MNIIYNKNKRKNAGFTLMEVLIATSVFVLVALASLSIYVATLKASQKTIALTRIQQESQLIMGVLAKKIRTSRVNYNYYVGGPSASGEDELAVTDLAGDEYVFALDTDNNSLSVEVNDSGNPQDIPAENVSIDDVAFFINPTDDPFITLDAPPSSQPYVTIVMTISSSKGKYSASLTIQQTVPQRSGGIVP